MKACDIHCGCTIHHEQTLKEVEETLHTDKTYQSLVDIFKIFSDHTRIKMLEAIKDHDLCVCDLAHLLGVSKSAVSHQMRFLKTYDLIEGKKEGKMVFYRLKNDHAHRIIDHARQLMKGQLI